MSPRFAPGARDGYWVRTGGGIVLYPRTVGLQGELDELAVAVPSRRDLIDPRVDFHAQQALHRMFSGDASARADAGGMFAAIKGGRLAGIYIVNQQVPALRAKRMNLGWWQVIPADQDAVLLLDPAAAQSGPPLIVFRDAVKLDPPRLDAALRKAWTVFRFILTGQASRCLPSGGMVSAETASHAQLRNVMPPIFCAKPDAAVMTSPAAVSGCRYEPDEKRKSQTSRGSVEPLFPGPRVLESALLFDFASGSSITKPTHEEYLKRIIAANNLGNPKSSVRVALIEGFTDCVDTETVNAPLRFQRAERVAFRLSQLGVHPANLGTFIGATIGENPGDDRTRLGRARNRSVTVLLEKRTPSRRRRRTPKAGVSVCPGSTRFSIRLLGSFVLAPPGGVSPGVGQLEFEIVDHECNRAQSFILTAGGGSVGTPSICIEPSDEKSFVTERPLLFEDFEGPGLWDSAVAQHGLGASFDGIAIPNVIMTWFGWTGCVGVGGSILFGRVSRSGRERKTGSGSIPHDPTR